MKSSPLVRTLPDHKTFSSLPNGGCRPISQYARIKNIHNVDTHTKRVEHPSQYSSFIFVLKNYNFVCCNLMASETGAKSLSKANNKFEEHTLGQFTQPDFTFKPLKADYSHRRKNIPAPNCETQPPASIGWVALSSVVRCSVVTHRWHLLSSPLYDVSKHTNHIFSVRIWS